MIAAKGFPRIVLRFPACIAFNPSKLSKKAKNFIYITAH